MGERKFWDRLFPPEYDFHELLRQQADKTLEGIKALVEWVYTGKAEKAARVKEIESEADEIRLNLVEKIGNAFSTPLDRQDIFHMSRRMDEIVNYAQNTVREVSDFKLEPDDNMREMVDMIMESMKALHKAFHKFEENPGTALEYAQKSKKMENQVERVYRKSVKSLLEEKKTTNNKSGDGDHSGFISWIEVEEIILKREVYRHISNTSDRIDETADSLLFAIIKHV